jgi:class 3 adenylate cyclase/tetratricopeptide (TPR) repeat protein
MSPKIEERRLITTLFADISGFTALSYNLDPEEVRDIVNICFEFLNNIIVKYGGTIHKYEGDLVIALFGFPDAFENDPERAVEAALEMIRLLPEMNETLSEKSKIKTEIGLHIGINSGTVFIGEVGSTEKMEYTVVGESVNLASRLKDTAKTGEILVSEPVFRASRYLFEYNAYPPITVKGIDQPIRVFIPTGKRDKPEPKRGIKGLFSPMVGRDKELNILKESVKNLINGKGGACFILGHAGLGKTRLFTELKDVISNRHLMISILESRSLAFAETVPFSPFLQIFEHLCGISDQDSPESIQQKFLKKTKEIFPDTWTEIVPYIGYLFSVRFADELDEKVKYLNDQGLKTQIFVSIKKLLIALAEVHPLLLVIDDYHCTDTASLELLEFIFDAPEACPILFLGISRIEKEKECFKTKEWLKSRLGDNFNEIVLKPLDNKSGTQLIYNLLEIPGFTEDFKEKILSKSEGNPFYLEEIIRSLIDFGVLRFASGVWEVTSDVSTFEIPDNIQSVISARLDQLEQDVRNVLHTASVIGRNFHVRILEHLGGFDVLMLTLYLATLEELEYIVETEKEPERQYMFKHPLLYEVSYNSLSKKKRRMLHQKTGETIEEIYSDRLDDFVEILAYQYANSDNIDKALEWLKNAGEKAKDRYANDEAIRYYQKTISVISENKKDKGVELCAAYEALGDIYAMKGEYELAIESYKEMFHSGVGNEVMQSKSVRKTSEIYHNQGRYDDALRTLDEAEEMLTGDDEEQMFEKSQTCIMRCWILRLMGEMEEAVKEGEKGLTIADDLHKLGKLDEREINLLRVRGFNNLGTVFYNKGKYDRTIELYQKCLDISEQAGDKRGRGVAIRNLGLVYYEKGESDKAIEFFKKGLNIFREIGTRRLIGVANSDMGSVFAVNGEYDKAIEYYGKALKIFVETGNKHRLGEVNGGLGGIYQNRGKYDKAIGFYQKAIQLFEEIGYKRGIAMINHNLGTVYMEISQHKKANQYLRDAESILKKIGDNKTLLEVYIALANLKCEMSKVETEKPRQAKLHKEATEWAGMAAEMVEELGSKSDMASYSAMHGRVNASLGDFRAAEEHFQKAIKLYEELDQKKSLADTCLEYAIMLKKESPKSSLSRNLVGKYLTKARKIYGHLKMHNKIKECN